MKLFSWMTKSRQCMFCWQWADASKAETVIDERVGKKVVRVEYECKNHKCKYLNFNRGPNTQAILYTGDKYIAAFEANRKNKERVDVFGQVNQKCNETKC